MTTPSPERQGVRHVLGILAAHNLIQNSFLNERGYVTGNLAVSALLLGVGRRSGSSWEEMGLGPPDMGSTVRFGAVATLAAATGAVAAMTHPRARSVLHDERAQVSARGEVWRRALVRFPVGTALFEEIAFRGVLPAVLSRDRGIRRADALSAGVFALWHLIPTARVMAGNPLGYDESRHRRATRVVIGSAAAGVAGWGLSWLRRRTDSLLAPWLVHASVNSIAFLTGVAAQRRSDPS